jgi:hypothetical protein
VESWELVANGLLFLELDLQQAKTYEVKENDAVVAASARAVR